MQPPSMSPSRISRSGFPTIFETKSSPSPIMSPLKSCGPSRSVHATRSSSRLVVSGRQICGAGPLKSKLANDVRGAGLEASFELAGQRTNLGEEYAKDAIFCHPALCKGFDLAPLEALALELPVIAYSDCAEVNRFVVDGQNGLLADRGDEPASLAAALERLILDPELRQKLGGNGPASVAGLSEENFANAWVELIERVTASEVSVPVR
jgi:glycosyltransferase involved in cell wall biosynthesis